MSVRDGEVMVDRAHPARDGAAATGLADAEVAALYQRYRPALLRFFERRGFAISDAEDLTQEVFIKISRLDSSAELWEPQGFLFRVAGNVLKDQVRRNQVRHVQDHVALDDEAERLEDPGDTEAAYERHETLTRLMQLMHGLTPKCRAVLLLNKYEGLSYAEIAQRFGISVSAVEKHMIHALKHLRARWTPPS
jgi:RNA polymerase sigma factor (sigma-70 family)